MRYPHPHPVSHARKWQRDNAVGLTVGALLATALTPVLLAPTPAYAAFGRLNEPASTPIVGAPFALDGYITRSSKRRPVVLQAKIGKRWQKLMRKKATKKGLVKFRGVVLPKAAQLRLVAPKTRNKWGKRLPRITSKSIHIQPIHQSARAAALPPLAQPGPVPADPAANSLVSIGFTPPRPGRPVVLQKLTDSGWQAVTQVAQDGSGYAVFDVPPGGTYRGVGPALGDASEVVSNEVVSRTFALDFDERFDGTAVTAPWADRPQGPNPDGGRRCSRPDSSVRTVGGGTFNMGVGIDPSRSDTCAYESSLYGSGESPHMLNTQITTEPYYTFTYGFAAARMKMQRSRGMHSCFWFIQPGEKVPGDPSRGTEVDIAEWFGDKGQPGRVGFGSFIWELTADNRLHKTGEIFRQTELMKAPGETWWDAYHVFSVEWTPHEYIFRVDGREYWRTSHAISHSPEYLVLSLFTSDWELGAPGRNLDDKAHVDWVRVWKH